MRQILSPDLVVIHTILSPEQGVREIPGILGRGEVGGGEEGGEEGQRGDGERSEGQKQRPRPAAIVCGPVYTDDMVGRMRGACSDAWAGAGTGTTTAPSSGKAGHNGNGNIGTVPIPWFQADKTQKPPMPSGEINDPNMAFMEYLAGRIKRRVREVVEELGLGVLEKGEGKAEEGKGKEEVKGAKGDGNGIYYY